MKRLAPLAVIALLAAGLLGFTGIRASAAPQAAQPTPSQTCILIIICFPAPRSSSPSSPAAPSLPLPTPSLPLPTPSLPAPSLPTPPISVPGSSGLASAARSAVSGRPASGRPSPSATTPRDATAAPGLVVSNATWTMTVSSATMTRFTYKGNIGLPLAGGGTVQMMEFTVGSMTMTHAVTQITEDGQTGTETDASFSAGGVTMYATRLSGSILGVPVTFTPSTTSAVLLSVANLATGLVPITMTSVTADQAVILAGQAQKTAVGVSG
jgi:uncharacterized membrane protein YtjA (UPF0391 family)